MPAHARYGFLTVVICLAVIGCGRAGFDTGKMTQEADPEINVYVSCAKTNTLRVLADPLVAPEVMADDIIRICEPQYQAMYEAMRSAALTQLKNSPNSEDKAAKYALSHSEASREALRQAVKRDIISFRAKH